MYSPYSCWKKGIYYTNPNILGKNIDIAGKYVTSNKATNIIAKYGNMYLITLSIVTPPTRHPVKRIVPTGGVIVPIDKLKQRRIPKCSGSCQMLYKIENDFHILFLYFRKIR